ncbi:putative Ig domain-containing protein [Corynebacterium coyleae]|uniref:putative Ig domain-containing protein n=1 Tax=Corynebacterium coyleae TaxID=53374 RepID=UPI0015E12274|nr:putative Ig domain-containing protein [Corynebacterium coyleae]
MKKSHIGRRRGTSVAAAALSFALVAPLAQPVAFAQEETAAVSQAPATEENGAIVADGIANGYVKSATGMTNAKSTLSGRAFIDDGYGFSPTDGGQQAVPEGTKVYMQWIDKDGAVSPVYVARTSDQLSKSNTSQAGPGSYVFDLREPWIDHHGKKHTYKASTNQYYRLWIDPFVDERNGFTVYPFRQVGGFFPGAYRNSMGADQQGAWNTIGTNMQRTAVLMQADRDVPYMHKPKADWIADTDETVPRQATNSAMKGHVGGKVWHETKDARLNGPNDTGDVPAKDMYVVMSVLTQEGIGAYAEAVDTLPEAQKLAAAKKLLTEHPEYIAATVRSKVGEDGYYSVKFPEGTLTNDTKKYLYAHVETADGKIPSAYSAWRVPLFNSPKNNGTRNPAPIAAENFVQNPMWYNVNFALVPRHDVKLDITNFNMTDKPADIGDTAKLNVTGPFPVTPNKVVWKKNGKVVKTCDNIGSVADANACTITVPEDAETGDIFTAEFVTGENTVLAADSFTVVVPVVLPFGSVKDEYKEFDALSVLPNEPENKVEGARPTYKVDGLPEGLTFDPETGKISGTPTTPGTSEVIVTRDVKVTVKEERPVLDEDGNPKFMDPSAPEDKRVIKTETVDVEEVQHVRVPTLLTVTDSPLKAATINTEYEQEVVPTGFESHPHKLKVKDGSLEVANLPAGLDFDEKNGKITGTPTEEVEADEDTPNVTVTYTLVDHNNKEYKVTDRVPLPVGQKTTVDGTPKPVDPTDEKQGTGVKVSNPDKDTKVSAKDEDGKDVPAVINPETGEIEVTPGKDVDGPITVTVEDEDLPEGKTEVEVPVNGHEKDRDDNGSDKTTVDGTPKPVDPTEDKQGTGIIVNNPDKDTKVSAKDEDGKDVPAVINPETGEIEVTPGEDVDGPIIVTVEDEDLPEGKTEVEVPVNGHEKDRDDNGSEKTTVDGTPKPVDPTEDKQGTGIIVNNSDKDTKVSAKDEDGKDVPAVINPETGEIEVTPGEDVDGPIIVTVEDEDLPEGKTEVEVPVNGHEKDRDDNGSEKTTVDASNVTPVDPTEDKQGTGIIVNNSDKDTKVSAKDEDGKDVPAVINPDTGEIEVTPGKDVDGPITVTVEDEDLPEGKTEVEVPVKNHEKGKDDNGSDKTTVDSSNVIPVDPTNDPQDTGIKVTNPDDDTKVTAKDEDGNDVPAEIDEDGNVIVTPGENVDGPIDVTITDPDLPGGKTEIEVPVNGHEKNQDDNGSDASDDKTTVDETGKTPVDPTDEKQGTGVVVENEDDETKVTAKDEDGKDVPVVINPDTGEIEVTPGEDVDGPINVTIEDPDLPNSKVEVEIDVNGHEKNRDDNGSDPANEDGTTVDGSNITPVNPTDDKQDTGIKVTNPDEDTKVTAKDEDGNDVPVEIDENGNVAVTPGTDVDGPITVTVEDPDLPNGKAEFEVPVNGHEKGRDDNGSDASDKTTVDQNDKKSVDPTDEKQGTGVKVNNPDKDTKVSAKDEDGKDIPVEIDPNTGEIVVTPGTDVDGPITVTIEDPDLDGGKTEIEIDVNGHEKGRDDNGSNASDDKTTVSPGKSTVTPNGKGQNVGKVDQGNSDKKGELTGELVDKDGNLIKGAKVTIDKDGNIIVSVPEGTPAGEAWVVVKEDGKEIHRFKIQIGETIDTGKCVATSVGFGLPLIALLPLGLATQIEIPGLSDFAAQANAQIQNVNTQLQQQLGIFNPQLAAQVEGLNKQLGQYGTDIATVAGGLALIAAGILAGTIIYDNCTPGGGSSVKDLELKGSSGKTYAGSSKEEKAPATTQKAEPKN